MRAEILNHPQFADGWHHGGSDDETVFSNRTSTFYVSNMHFGMLMEIYEKYEKEKVDATLNRMAEAHPFLKALIAYENGTDKLYYKITARSQINMVICDDASVLWEDYKKISDRD